MFVDDDDDCFQMTAKYDGRQTVETKSERITHAGE